MTLAVPFTCAGHLVSSILVHMLCNYMGVPDITFSIAPGNPRESTRTSVLYEHRKGGLCHWTRRRVIGWQSAPKVAVAVALGLTNMWEHSQNKRYCSRQSRPRRTGLVEIAGCHRRKPEVACVNIWRGATVWRRLAPPSTVICRCRVVRPTINDAFPVK